MSFGRRLGSTLAVVTLMAFGWMFGFSAVDATGTV
jgi:hypothetical protein